MGNFIQTFQSIADNDRPGVARFACLVKFLFQLGFFGAVIAGIVILCMASHGGPNLPEWMSGLGGVGGIHGLSTILICGGTFLWVASGVPASTPTGPPEGDVAKQPLVERRLLECHPPATTGM